MLFLAFQLWALHRSAPQLASSTLALGVLVIAMLVSSGFFGAPSARVRALFGESATRTGNPLVDSVAEHQPSSPEAYWRYLDKASYVAPFGMLALAFNPTASGGFAVMYAASTYFFSLKMSRLMIFTGALVLSPAC